MTVRTRRAVLRALVPLLAVTLLHAGAAKANGQGSVGQLKATIADIISLDSESFRRWCNAKKPVGSYYGADDGSASCAWYINPAVSRDKSRTAGASVNYLRGQRLPVRAVVFHPDVPYGSLLNDYKKHLGPPSCKATQSGNPCWVTKMGGRDCRVVIGRDDRSTHILVYLQGSEKL
jgi:hypothetical protein